MIGKTNNLKVFWSKKIKGSKQIIMMESQLIQKSFGAKKNQRA